MNTALANCGWRYLISMAQINIFGEYLLLRSHIRRRVAARSRQMLSKKPIATVKKR